MAADDLDLRPISLTNCIVDYTLLQSVGFVQQQPAGRSGLHLQLAVGENVCSEMLY